MGLNLSTLISILSRINLGWQITFPFSKCGRTIVVNTPGMVTAYRHVKVALIRPNKRDTFFYCLGDMGIEIKFLVNNTPKSFSILMSPNISFSMWYFNLWFELPRWRLLQSASLKRSCHLCDHFTGLSLVAWHGDLQLSELHGTASCQQHIFVAVLLTTSGRSFKKMTNR